MLSMLMVFLLLPFEGKLGMSLSLFERLVSWIKTLGLLGLVDFRNT